MEVGKAFIGLVSLGTVGEREDVSQEAIVAVGKA